MFRQLKSVLALGIVFVYFIPLALALSIPAPKGYVNDFGNLLSPQAEKSLDQQLTQFEKKTSHEIVVATIPDLQGITIEDFAVQLFEQWKIGKEGTDNGALLLVSAKEREVRIEVGYGLEPVITDGDAGNIIRTIVVPEFKVGNYDAGVTKAAQSLMLIAQGEKVDFPVVDQEEEAIAFGAPLIFFAIGILQYIGAFLARTKSWYAGGILGGVIGLILSSVLAMSFTNGAVVAGVLALLGALLDYVLSKNYQYRRDHHLGTSWGRSGGGFWFGGSSSGDGGFGGFGGGRSGGGGSSGRW